MRVELVRGCAGHGDAGGVGGVLSGWDADAAVVPHRNRGGGPAWVRPEGLPSR